MAPRPQAIEVMWGLDDVEIIIRMGNISLQSQGAEVQFYTFLVGILIIIGVEIYQRHQENHRQKQIKDFTVNPSISSDTEKSRESSDISLSLIRRNIVEKTSVH